MSGRLLGVGEPVSAIGSCKLSQEIEAALCPVALGLATTRPQTHRSGIRALLPGPLNQTSPSVPGQPFSTQVPNWKGA